MCCLLLLAIVGCKDPASAPTPANNALGKESPVSVASNADDSLSAYLDTLMISAATFNKLQLLRKTRAVYRYEFQNKKLQLTGYSFSCPGATSNCKPVLDSTAPFMTTASLAASKVVLKNGTRLTSLVLRDKDIDRALRAISKNKYKTILFVPQPDTQAGSDGFKWSIYFSKDDLDQLKSLVRQPIIDGDAELNPAPPRGYGTD
ncbi:MAG: hypothetical protein EAY75_07010 [Bacteroidetes bacterium]|nr:MAG: hypothetical protein EAY75_07010 [Bacteroidota bacterium]